MTDKQEFNNAANRGKQSGIVVVNYDEVDAVFADSPERGQELKEKMEEAMAGIGAAPDDTNVIFKFGEEPVLKLGKCADEVLKAQDSFDAQVRAMKIAADDIDRVFSKLGLEELKDGVTSLVSASAKLGSKGVKGFGKAVKKLSEIVTRSEAKKTEQQKHVDEMLAKLPEAYKEMQIMSKKLRALESGINDVIREARKLGKERVDMVKELNVYLGAAPEVLRRYDEIYIKEMNAEYTETSNPEIGLKLDDVIKGKSYFRKRYNTLESSATQAYVAAEQLKAIIEGLIALQLDIRESIDIRENEWKAILAAARFSASTLMAQMTVQQVGEVGDKTHKLGKDMLMKADEIRELNESRAGTVDHKELLDTLDKIEKSIQARETKRRARELEEEDKRAELRAGRQKLIDAVEQIQANRRILDSAPEETTKKADAPAPAANDNTGTEASDLDLADVAPPNPARKKTGGGAPIPK